MISSTDFKKQISKALSEQLKVLGFKGSGFNYKMDSDNYIFTIGVQANRYGGECCVEFGIQPKSIDSNGSKKLDFKKLKYYECEIRTRLSPDGKGNYWLKYSDDEKENIQTANQIVELINQRAKSVIQLLTDNPNYFETIEPSDLDNMYKSTSKILLGMNLMTTEIRLAWLLTKLLERTNPNKAKAFAKYGLLKLDSTSTFFGKKDFEKILAESNG